MPPAMEKTQNTHQRRALPGAPSPMRYGHVRRAAGAWERAFARDPLFVYLDADRSPFQTRAKSLALLVLWNMCQMVLGFERGGAFIVVDPGINKHQRRIGALVQYLSSWIYSICLTAEQKKRLAKHRAKASQTIKETLGDRCASMAYVSVIATAPKSQGRGYGGALLDNTTDLADAAGQVLYLKSSNTGNNAFYRPRGIETVGTYYLGGDNPKWAGAPIPIQIMVREPRRQGGIVY